MRVSSVTLVALWLICSANGCGGGSEAGKGRMLGMQRDAPLPLGMEEEAEDRGSGSSRCDASAANRDATEFDTSGDGRADVRKVYLRLGVGDTARQVLICRESDLNADGRKDVIRYYDDSGKSLREDSDRNFDGRVDASTSYQDNQIVLQEQDNNFDGVIDSRITYRDGRPVRAERDTSGLSEGGSFHPNRWEYYEDGRMVRMGTDIDGDGTVDRWDRDQAHSNESNDEAIDEMAATAAEEDAPSESADSSQASREGAKADSSAKKTPEKATKK